MQTTEMKFTFELYKAMAATTFVNRGRSGDTYSLCTHLCNEGGNEKVALAGVQLKKVEK